MITKHSLFIWSCIGFLLWVFTHNITMQLSISLLALLIFVVFLFCIFFFIKKYFILCIAIVLSFSIWILLSHHKISQIEENQVLLQPFYNQRSHISIQIKEVTKINDYEIQYTWKLIKIQQTNIESKIYGNIKLSKVKKLKKWDIIHSDFKIYQLQDFDGFSYEKYMLSKNIYFSGRIYDFEIIHDNNNSVFENFIHNIRDSCLHTIEQIYPKNEALFLWWILIGARESLPQEIKQDFNTSGLTHFIAVSWFNITILIIFMSYIIWYFPIILRIICITGFIIFFTLLVWDTAPVVRASIMWLLWYYILVSGRQADIWAIILTTALIMISISPLILNYDVSFQLSFLAVLWIIYTHHFFEKIFYFLPDILEIKTAFSLTLSSLVFTFPIIALNFGQLSILSLLANIAVSWTIPIAMFLGFLSVCVYYVYSPWAIFIWYFWWIFLKWDMLMVDFFWNQDWAVIHFDFWIYKYHLEILYFIVMVFLILYFRKKEAQA